MFIESVVMCQNKVLIFDSCFATTGHNHHYNKSLSDTLIFHGHIVDVIEIDNSATLASIYRLLELINSKINYNTIILPTPTFIQYILCSIFSFIFHRKRFFIFIRRLDEKRIKKKIKNIFYRLIFSKKNLIPLVDNIRVAEHLRLVHKTFVLPIPPRANYSRKKIPDNKITNFLSQHEITFAFLGRLHYEKGMMHYEILIEHILKFESVGVFLQLSADENDNLAQHVYNSLAEKYKRNSHVYIHIGQLSDADYETVIESSDIGVTPYNVDAYGYGTSGVAAEFIMSGKVLLSSELDWLLENYKSSGVITFFDPKDRTLLLTRIEEAVSLSRNNKVLAIKYVDDWSVAVNRMLE
jgi:hypothetical protein